MLERGLLFLCLYGLSHVRSSSLRWRLYGRHKVTSFWRSKFSTSGVCRQQPRETREVAVEMWHYTGKITCNSRLLPYTA